MKWYSYIKALGIVTISKIILSSYKILTRSLQSLSDNVAHGHYGMDLTVIGEYTLYDDDA